MAIGLETGEVHVWRADLDRGPLPADRRRRRLEARQALHRVLAGYLGARPEEVRLRRGPHGKPALAGETEIRFNLSHSGGTALIAVARGLEVGVDVEETRPRRDFLRLADVALESDAAAAVRAAAPQDRATTFYSEWVRREAIVKCLGTGLGAPPPERPVHMSGCDAGPGHAAAVAVEPDAMLPTCQTRPPGKVARLGAGKALALLSSAAASSALT
jgi:4'-phosphopantetheinyl transferase superfamily protein